MNVNGFEYHRNGVSVWPFWVACDADNLRVVFYSNDSEDGPDPEIKPFKVSVESLRYASLFLVGTSVTHRIVKVNDRMGVVVFRDHEDQNREDPRIMVGIVDLVMHYDVRCAVLDVARLPDVRFGYNSWRGDHYHAEIYSWLGRS